MKPGMVYLVGAGPGDPGLISEHARRALKNADCVVYDFLANAGFVDGLSCELIYVGKEGSAHTMKQEDINRLIVEKARAGKTVVRLKGGDPFVFGRGGEEAEELIAAGVTFRIIPGISSFYSAPAYAGIPLTHRDYADAFEVVTGHRRADAAAGEDINFPDFDDKKTFVFLMGMKNLGYIAETLIAEKRFPADLPAAVIMWGATARQRVAAAALADIASEAARQGLAAPAIIVIGRVVALREKLRWFDSLPLFGKRIVVTRTREQASVLSEKLAALGADVVEFPTIRIARRGDLSDLRAALADIGSYRWIVFTSQNAVSIFFDELAAAGMDARALAGARIAAIGPATANELRVRSINPDLVPAEYVAEAVIDAMKTVGVAGSRVLLPCATEARAALADGLRSLGATVERIHLYDTVVPDTIDPDALVDVRDADMVTFASSSTVRNFFAIVKESRAQFACIGPITADALKELGHDPAVVAPVYTIDGLVDAISGHYEKY